MRHGSIVASLEGPDYVRLGHQAVADFLVELLPLSNFNAAEYLEPGTPKRSDEWINYGWELRRIEKDVCILAKKSEKCDYFR